MKTVQQADADVFTAIAHPTRRQLLDLLVQGERSVNNLATHFSVTRPAISQHLRVLLDTGFVSGHREGRERIYRLETAPLQEIDAWLEPYRRLWDARLDRLDGYLQELQQRKDETHGDKE